MSRWTRFARLVAAALTAAPLACGDGADDAPRAAADDDAGLVDGAFPAPAWVDAGAPPRIDAAPAFGFCAWSSASFDECIWSREED